MLKQVIDWCLATGIPKNRIVIEMDSWFSSRPMLDFVRKFKVLFRIDSKMSYTVRVPDAQAIQTAKTQKHGKKRTHFTKTVKMTQYLGDPSTWHWFYDPVAKKKIWYNQDTITLNTGSRVTVYAYLSEGLKNPKYLLANAKKISPTSPKTVYRDYSYRWRIEEAHRDLKQQFGLGKCQNRVKSIVTGFLGFITLCYSWYKYTFWSSPNDKTSTACPIWAQEFHTTQIQNKYPVPA